MFVDKAKIKIKAGDGGNGCCSFRREAFLPKGGPSGGDGGDGGNVVFIADPGEMSLVDYVYTRHFAAKNGENGMSKDMHGRRAENLRLKVPLGTVVKDLATGEVIADIDAIGKEVVVATGGIGGRGNARFASSVNRAPRNFEYGTPGEERELFLELKTIADVGLVGFPNAGKSTLLGSISAASPKVAPYPFTTLHPVVGIVDYNDFKRVTVADIPGLIDGASENRGLGHDFLRHIERTRMLAYVLDMGGVDGRDPLEDFRTLQKELELYQKGLSKRKSIIIANKMDLPESAANLKILKSKLRGRKIVPISASTDGSFDELLSVLRERLEK